ncbi:uncharacterized protein LOC135107458 isoform X2 [Scylla paramamosain]|uniref:uncharacterized protein LOC135107458 isoform X2 n=1 Tax=Scylla paramamosain TaxID=85552 RepID=UPI003083190C
MNHKGEVPAAREEGRKAGESDTFFLLLDMPAVWTAALVCLLAGMAPLAQAIQVTVVCADLVGAGGVGIRVWPSLKASPERHSKTMHFRLLQVNWEAERLLEGDWVGLFEDDPRPPHLRPPPTPMPPTSHRDWRAPQPIFWDTPFATQGTLTTNYTQPRIELSVLARGGCVGPYVGFVRNGVCVAAECLASHPTWLYDHRAVLGNRSLRSLVLPGTHNAGSYSLADDNDVVASWVVCQDEDILSQLLYGNRYLDLRVGYYPETRELLWINHDLVRWRPLQDVLDAVRGFLALSPDPVIIDIHRTPVGFHLPESLELMLSLMNTTLGSHFVHNRHGPHVTLDDLWQMGKRVVFTFIDPTVSDHTPWVWPPVPQAWANAQLVDDLRTFLDAEMNMRFESPRLWAAMAHLTPSLWDLLFRSHIGVRGYTDRVNFSITRWLRQRWGHMANIVASDFFMGNNIINVAIRTNLALSMCRPSDPSRHPYTLRWTTELALRSGSPSTTIPPFVRRMYSGGTMWSTTGVHQIHYPFIPIDANISKVFTAIPNRIPSEAPGVTYQDSGDSWHKIFHYPTDGSTQPPVPITSRPHSQPISSTTPPSVAVKSSSTASVETIMINWDDVDSQDFLDEAFSSGMSENAPVIASELPSLGEGNVPVPLPRELANNELAYDAFNNTNTVLSTSNRTPNQNHTVLLDQRPRFAIGSDNLENEFMSSLGNIQNNDDSLLLVNNDTLSDSLSVTNNTNSSSFSTIINPTHDKYHFNTTLQNSVQSTNKSTEDDRYLLVSDDVKDTNNSSSVQDDALMVSPTVRMLFEQSQSGIGRSTGSGVTRVVWHSDSAGPGTESINDKSESDLLALPRYQTPEHLTEQPRPSEPSAKMVGAPTLTKYSSVPQVKSHTAVKEQARASTVTVRPNTPILSSQSAATIKVQPTTSTVKVQPDESTITTPMGVVDLTGTKSSSQVT